MMRLYRPLSAALTPWARHVLRRRERRGKEEAERLPERMGQPGRPRPDGPLIWIHAASVGEALSTLPVVERIARRDRAPHVLVTTGTVTSARLMADRLPDRAFHQYVPVDCAPWVTAFLDHWRPDAALWTESELWPNLVTQTGARGIPMALINARLSRRSFRRWRRLPWLGKPLVRAFRLIAAESTASAERYTKLGGREVVAPGNIKHAAAPLPVDDMELVGMRSAVGGRPLWIAASTHPGEEKLVAEAHRAIRRRHQQLLTIVVPRHPERGAAVMADLAADDITLAQRSKTQMPGATTGIYVADTLGELGLFYRLAEIVFVGGTLAPKGGQNPIEPAMLDSAILHGPSVENFADIFDALTTAGGSFPVADASALAAAVMRLLDSRDALNLATAAARAVAEGERHVIDRLMNHLYPFLDDALAASARPQRPDGSASGPVSGAPVNDTAPEGGDARA
jgi:3-deoxy-D-manno-octulosonic-acid transferase